MLDFAVRHDKEVVVEPKETSAELRSDCYFNVHEQAATVAVSGSNGIANDCRNLIALGRILGCSHRLPVAECLYSFAGFNAIPCSVDSSRARRETDIGDIVVILCDKTFWYVFASQTNTSPQPVPAAIQRPSSDTATQLTNSTSTAAICLPSFTCHTRIPPSPPVQR